MVLLIGKLPPPIGGISIHIKRLTENLENFNLSVLDYSKERSLLNIFYKIHHCKVCHVHLSKKFIRCLVVLILKVLGKKIIVTFHGEYDFRNYYDYITLVLCDYAIVLNKKSFSSAQKIKTRNLDLIGAYIPVKDGVDNSLSIENIEKINDFCGKYKTVFCTNAWNVVFDKNGLEIYGGSLLVSIFQKNINIALLFSDPIGNYRRFLLEKSKEIPDNIYFLDFSHNFTDVIPLCDAFIRSTTTDGDSLSIHESLELKKDVIASNVVDRPEGCILYRTQDELEQLLLHFDYYRGEFKKYKIVENVNKIKGIYSFLLNK